jgi:exopolysaccharide biosynthesis polyprenyl glycosylphosphotransferase
MNTVLSEGLAIASRESIEIPAEQLMEIFLAQKAERIGKESVNEVYASIYNYAKTNKANWFLKRLMDIGISIAGILILSPLFILISIIVSLDSKGPILFSQERIGLRGRSFKMLKFRSMYIDAEERLQELLGKNESEVLFKMKDDPRITKVGKVLRKYSLDEFPQLINVLKGEMSLVGPRPAIHREVELYKDWHYARLSTLPGMTGLWQVMGRSNIKDFDHVASLDIHYLENWSFLNDLIIILKTIPIVISTHGAA